MSATTCPRCRSTDTAEIIWGYPLPDDEMLEDLDGGRTVLGGCILPLDPAPDHVCHACGNEWVESNEAARVEGAAAVSRWRSER